MVGPAPIPVSIVGGFLGAGKTSLLNRLLAESGGRRLGLIVNDFGDINIDEKLIVARDETMVSLANGCICCSIGSDFLRALVSLVTRPDPPEQIVIEASGVADPARIAAIARADPALSLQGVIVLVDTLEFTRQLSDPLLRDTLEGQVRAADLLVLTKTDLSQAAEVSAAEAALRTTGATARMLPCPVGDLPVGILFELDGGDAAVPPVSAGAAHPFWSGSFVSERPCDTERLRAVISALPPSLLRLKGIVHDPSGEAYVLQWVAGRFSLKPAAMPGAPVRSELVYIGVGEGGEESAVDACLSAAFA